MPLETSTEIEEDGSVDLTLCIKQIVDYVLSEINVPPANEGIQRIQIKKAVHTICDIMKEELPKNPMLELEMSDPKVRDMCRITLRNILVSYGVSERHIRRVMPRYLKSLSHIPKRYLYLPYSRDSVMIPERTAHHHHDKQHRSFSHDE